MQIVAMRANKNEKSITYQASVKTVGASDMMMVEQSVKARFDEAKSCSKSADEAAIELRWETSKGETCADCGGDGDDGRLGDGSGRLEVEQGVALL